MPPRIVGFLTRACIVGILAGIVAMIQPFVFELFKWGFLLLLASTVVYTVVSHLPDKAPEAADLAGPEEAPG